MARDGAGNFTRTDGVYNGSTIFSQQYLANQNLEFLSFDTHANDFATEITDSLSRSGKGAMLAALNFGGFRGVGISPGIARSDVAGVANVQDGTGKYVGSAGTGSAYTMTLNPAITAYAETTYGFRAHTNNLSPCTLNINGLGALPFRSQNGGIELAAGTIQTGDIVLVHYDVNGGGRFLLLASSRSAVFSSPVSIANGGTGATTAATARAALSAAVLGINTDLTELRNIASIRAPAGSSMLFGANGNNLHLIDTGGNLQYGVGGADFNVYQQSGSNGALGLFGGSVGNGASLTLYGSTHPSFPRQAVLKTGNLAGLITVCGANDATTGACLVLAGNTAANPGKVSLTSPSGDILIQTEARGDVQISSGGNFGSGINFTVGGFGRLFLNSAGDFNLGSCLTATTVGAAGAAAALPATPQFYWRVKFDGTEFKIPCYLA